jgi:hypothetical protein
VSRGKSRCSIRPVLTRPAFRCENVNVLTGVFSLASGFAIGALAVYQYRDRQSMVEAERHLFGTKRTRDWPRFWAFRKTNVVLGSVLFAVISAALIANGVVDLFR